MACYIKKGRTILTMTVVVFMVVHHTTADLPKLIHLAAKSHRERPERAALEPPTVTSLNPSERHRRNSQGIGGISVPSEQSGSHIPPVVASRSPSNSYPRNYKNRYIHVETSPNQPVAPVPTVSSRSQSRNAGVLTGRRTLSDTHFGPVVPPPPSPHLVNGSTHYPPHPSHWNPPLSHAPRNRYGTGGYPPLLNRGYPRRPNIYEETGVPTSPYASGRLPVMNPYGGGGVWGKTREEPSEGFWEAPRYPSNPYSPHRGYPHRTDTFGHSISEDLSHLSDKYPHQSTSRDGQLDDDIHIIHQGSPHPSNRNHHKVFQTQSVQEESFSPTSSVKVNSEEKSWMPPTTYGSSLNTGQIHTNYPEGRVPEREIPSETFHRNIPLSISNPHTGSSSDDEADGSRLTMYGVWKIVNTSSSEGFEDYIRRKGINIRQVEEKLNAGAKIEDIAAFLNKPDLLTTPQPVIGYEDRTKGADVVRTSYTDSVPPSVMALDDTAHRHSSSRSREGRKRKRKQKNKKRRKNKDNRKAGKKNKQETELETIHPEESGSPLGMITGEESVVTEKPVTTSTLVTLVDTPPGVMVDGETVKMPFNPQIPIQTTSFEQMIFEPGNSFPQAREFDERTESPDLASSKMEVTEHFDSPSWPQEERIPSTTKAKIQPILSPTASLDFSTNTESVTEATEFITSARMPTPLPTFREPSTGSLTLPPATKPSEVSIISFTVMKIPNEEKRQETVLEDLAPSRTQPTRRKSHKIHDPPPQRMNDKPWLFSSATPKKIEDDMVVRTPFKREEKDNYAFPVKGFMIITGIMGALAVFTLVVLISYAIIKCTKQPVVNNYQVSEQKPATQ